MNQIKYYTWLLLLLSCCYSFSSQAQCLNSYTIETLTAPTCIGAANGTLRADGITFYSNATYQWSNGSSNRHVYNVSPGHYTVTITDPTTCTYVATTYVGPSPVGLTVNPNYNACRDRLNAGLGWPYAWPVTYLWSDGSTNEFIDNPNPGVYSVTITDATGCAGQGSVTVVPGIPPLSITYTTTPSTCNASTGSIDITVSGGVPPYTYNWYGVASGQNVEDPTNLPVGTANIFIRDANNCTLWESIPVPGPSLDLAVTNASCGLTNNGSITATTPFLSNPTFLWSNGATTPTITGLSVGGYGLTVTDGNCILTDSVLVGNGGFPTVSIDDSLQNSICNYENLYAFAHGGAPDPSAQWPNQYTYLWNTGATTSEIQVQAGVTVYMVTITDANGCTAADTLDIGSPLGGPNFSAVIQDATCGNSDGAIDLTIGGLSPNSILWSPTGATTEDITGIAAGFHIVEVTNASGCVFRDTFPVGEFIEVTATDASCGQNNGSIDVQDYGMSNPIYAWSTGATTSSLNNLAAGQYIVTVSNGSCNIIDTIDIINAGQVTAGIRPGSNCNPSYLLANGTDGATPYTYLWNDGTTTVGNTNNITPGNTYTVTLTDANGCTDVASFQVPVYPTVSATATSTDATCNNKNGAISLTMTGGVAPFNYAWSYGSANVQHLTGVYPGQYSVSITDNNGCEAVLSNIPVNGQTNVSVSASFTFVTAANTGGGIDITVTGVTNPTFLWSNGATTEDITNLSSGFYEVSITDAATGCIFTRDYLLPGPHVNNPNIRIYGYVYDVSATGLCQAGLPLQYEMVRLMPSNLVAFTDAYGRYEFNVTNPGTYTVEYINSTPLTTTVVCPAGGIATHSNTAQGNGYAANFYLTNPPAQDLEVDLIEMSNATPGFVYETRILYKNKGNTIETGTLEYDYNALLGFSSITGFNSILTFHDIPNHKFNWSYSNLMPGESRVLDVKFTVPVSTPLGTVLTGTSDIFPQIGDLTPTDNTDILNTTVVGSWDPNDKQVWPHHGGDSKAGGTIDPSEEEIEYLIRFQNTGTAPAHFVIIRDTLDGDLLPETIRDVSTKHNADLTIENGNILVATFNNINLPDSAANFAASIGYIKFKINRVSGLPIGTSIENTAAIYFDYNAPVITNTPVLVVDYVTSIEKVAAANIEVQAMPNPFDAELNVQYTLEDSDNISIQLMNNLGQRVYQQTVDVFQEAGTYNERLDLEHLPSGVYLLQVSGDTQTISKKIIKR